MSLFGGHKYGGETVTNFNSCLFRIIRKGSLIWNGYQLGSGFELELIYAKDCRSDGSIIGVTHSYDLTAELAQFLYLNRRIIESNICALEENFRAYRVAAEVECRRKADALSYSFLLYLYNHPQSYRSAVKFVNGNEQDLRVRQLFMEEELAIQITYDRYVLVESSPIFTWWYIFWVNSSLLN